MIAGAAPRLSFIIPAFDAEATLARALRSVRRQTARDWEAVIVDDGSTDRTAAIGATWSRADPRVRLIRRTNGGAAAARNSGLAVARSDLVTFLDADDTLAPSFMSRMLRRLGRSPGAVGVACGCTRRAVDGRMIERRLPGPIETDLRRACRRTTPVAMHAAVLRRRLVSSVGGFDEALRTHEDWALWIAIAATGGRVVREDRALADYWCRPRSLTRDGLIMVDDHRRASERAGALFPELDADEAADEEATSSAASVLWNVFVAIGAGVDWRPVFDAGRVDERLRRRVTPGSMAPAVLSGLAIGAEQPIASLAARWPDWADEAARVFAALAAEMREPGLAYGLVKACERELLRADRNAPPVRLLSRTVGVRPRSSVLFRGVAVPPDRDSVLLTAGRFRRTLSVAALGPLSGAALRGRFARGLADELVRSAGGPVGPVIDRTLARVDAMLRPGLRHADRLARRVRRRLRGVAEETRTAVNDAPASAATGAEAPGSAALPAVWLPPTPAPLTGDAQVDAIVAAEYALVAASDLRAASTARTTRIGDPGQSSTALWDAFFSEPDPWGYDEPYEQIKYDRTLSLLADQRFGRALELACAEGRFTARLAPRCDRLRATDISGVALARTRERCAGFDNIDYAVLDFFEGPIGSDWDLIVCSEVLYYMHDRAQLERFARGAAIALAPGGRLLATHAFVLRDGAGDTGFDWDVPFGADVIADVLERVGGLERERTLRTPLYRIDLFRRPAAVAGPPPVDETHTLGSGLTPAVARWVVPHGAIRTRAAVAAERASTVPVLMYHRVADDGLPALARYRVTPAEFERQLVFLRRRGFRTIGLPEWERSRGRLSVHGRPILLTFDDAYVDFAENAWPLLQRYGFEAHVFVPTERVGGAADWDAKYGPPAPIMDWAEIARLAAEGVTFGSHLATHPASDCIPSEALLREAARSRAMLERVLSTPIHSIAPPYGAADSRTDSVFRLAGYRHGFRDGGGPARLWQLGIATPRIEVPAGLALADFAARLGVAVEPPDGGDRPIGPA